MKKILLVTFMFIVSLVNAQDFETINKLQSSSLSSLKVVTSKLANLSSEKFEFYKEKETPEYYVLVYLPIGLTVEEKEESRINRYENGIVFKLLKNEEGLYKLKEFLVNRELMYAIVNSVFYPNSNEKDFFSASNYRDYIDNTKGYKFNFYSGDSKKSKFRFYSN
ncbi:hypothetical protein KHA90_25045 [Flavobacterium psychroterrae]|uniref:DUF4252 domain-containing protein n=2 Tax=Flavobacterium psychroterrae TaxID=2133767 RepID=A0ABS5PJK3_9FLAO|nr:hypothetical protein [Flavobacterium psychroterrae]MBS7234266.1 hypothetical protein [Flavobacterium psychroterrae]